MHPKYCGDIWGSAPKQPFFVARQATTIFELPPDEIQLMREVTNEIQKARRWATFDALFGRLVLRKAQFFLDGKGPKVAQ